MVPSVFTPQVWDFPALTETKVPAGGVAWPALLSPQQAMVPSVFRPHVCFWPALTETKAGFAAPPGKASAPGAAPVFVPGGAGWIVQDATAAVARNKVV
jgi:hypothetical protein